MKIYPQITNFLANFPKISQSNMMFLGISLGTLGLIPVFTQSAVALDYFGNDSIEFQEDTVIEFEFLESHGAYESIFGVIDLDSCQTQPGGEIIFDSCQKTALLVESKPSDNYETVFRESTYEDSLGNRTQVPDFLGTPGNAVPVPTNEFLFKAGKKYAFYLESWYDSKLAGVVYSADMFNSQGNKQAFFDDGSVDVAQLVSRRDVPDSTINQYQALTNGGITLRFDDTGSKLVKKEYQDIDFDDFIIGIGGYQVDCYGQKVETPN